MGVVRDCVLPSYRSSQDVVPTAVATRLVGRVGGAARVRAPQFISCTLYRFGLAAGDQTPAPARDRTRVPRARPAPGHAPTANGPIAPLSKPNGQRYAFEALTF